MSHSRYAALLLLALPAPRTVAYAVAAGAPGADTARAAVTVVSPTVSLPDMAERRYAASLTRVLTGWLDDLGVRWVGVTDDEVIRRGMPGSVAVLPYNPFPPAAQKKELANFVGRGGTLLVFYGADEELAALMGMRVGAYMTSPSPGRWRAFRFMPEAVAHLPDVIRQSSRNIRPVYPASADARVLAHWEDAQGHATGHPAWVSSPQGFWMSHVLLNDGDTAGKKQLLLGLLGAVEPVVWRDAARQAMLSGVWQGLHADLGSAVAAIRAVAAGSARAAPTERALDKAKAERSGMSALFRQGRYAEVIRHGRVLDACLTEAMAAAQAPHPFRFKGVWDHSGLGLEPGDWDATCRVLAAGGITDVLPNMLWPGAAHFESRVMPASVSVKEHGDQVAQCLAAAHARGLRVHVWKVCWRVDRAAPQQVEDWRRQGRLQVSDQGEGLPWLCPSHPDNLRYEKDGVRDLVRRYAVDGIHLDYNRYPDSHACYCSGCRGRFEGATGRPVHAWPGDVNGGERTAEFRVWRAEQTTRLVRDLHAVVRKLRPQALLSAAVFGRYPLCRDSVGQDWGLWLAEGYVDFVCPMNYTNDRSRFRAWCSEQLALPSAEGRVFPGIGVTAKESQLPALRVLDQVSIAHELGAQGFILFELDGVLGREILPYLRDVLNTAD